MTRACSNCGKSLAWIGSPIDASEKCHPRCAGCGADLELTGATTMGLLVIPPALLFLILMFAGVLGDDPVVLTAIYATLAFYAVGCFYYFIRWTNA